MNIQPIVEGYGEVEALPVLLRRFVAEAQIWSVDIGRPIRRKRNQLTSEAEVNTAVKLARLQPECCAVLILFDGDSDCPAELGPQVQHWVAASACKLPCEVVIAHREYEAWFLAAIESLREYPTIRFASSPIHSGFWFVPWGRISVCGLPLPGQRMFEHNI